MSSLLPMNFFLHFFSFSCCDDLDFLTTFFPRWCLLFCIIKSCSLTLLYFLSFVLFTLADVTFVRDFSSVMTLVWFKTRRTLGWRLESSRSATSKWVSVAGVFVFFIFVNKTFGLLLFPLLLLTTSKSGGMFFLFSNKIFLWFVILFLFLTSNHLLTSSSSWSGVSDGEDKRTWDVIEGDAEGISQEFDDEESLTLFMLMASSSCRSRWIWWWRGSGVSSEVSPSTLRDCNKSGFSFSRPSTVLSVLWSSSKSASFGRMICTEAVVLFRTILWWEWMRSWFEVSLSFRVAFLTWVWRDE